MSSENVMMVAESVEHAEYSTWTPPNLLFDTVQGEGLELL